VRACPCALCACPQLEAARKACGAELAAVLEAVAAQLAPGTQGAAVQPVELEAAPAAAAAPAAERPAAAPADAAPAAQPLPSPHVEILHQPEPAGPGQSAQLGGGMQDGMVVKVRVCAWASSAIGM